jgi:hypothetical protein
MNKHLIIALCLFLGFSNILSAGKLRDVKTAVRSTDSSDDSDDNDDSDDGDDGYDFGNIIGSIDAFVILGAIVTSPIWYPHQIWDNSLISEFHSYPYQDNYKGYMKYKETDFDDYSFRTYFEGGYDFEGVTSVTCNLLLETESRFSFEVSGTFMREWIDSSTYDSLGMGKGKTRYSNVYSQYYL